MRFTLQREVLLKPLQQVVNVVERRQTMPVLANLLVSVKDNVLSVTASDTEVELVARCNLEGAEDGETTIPARKWFDIVRALPDGSQVTVKLNGDRVSVSAGRSRFVLSTLPADEFPSADELEVINARCLAIWRRSAEALQDNSRLRADVLTIRYAAARPARTGAESSCGELQGLDAQGSVYYVTPAQRVRANAAVYDAAADTITMTGDVVAAQGQNVLRGERLVIQVSTGQARMETSARGAGTPGRVRGVFYPNQTQGQPAAKR